MNDPFLGLSDVKREGSTIQFDGESPQPPKEKTVWIEVCVPKSLEDRVNEAITKVLIDAGYFDE